VADCGLGQLSVFKISFKKGDELVDEVENHHAINVGLGSYYNADVWDGNMHEGDASYALNWGLGRLGCDDGVAKMLDFTTCSVISVSSVYKDVAFIITDHDCARHYNSN